MKALVGAFNQEKALVGAFSVIVQPVVEPMDRFTAVYRFLSGQYVAASCTAIRPQEFHSLSITSAPHEDFLSVHVKAVGAWTWKLRWVIMNYLVSSSQ